MEITLGNGFCYLNVVRYVNTIYRLELRIDDFVSNLGTFPKLIDFLLLLSRYGRLDLKIPRPYLTDFCIYHFPEFSAECDTILELINEFKSSIFLVGGDIDITHAQSQFLIRTFENAGLDVRAIMNESMLNWARTEGRQIVHGAMQSRINWNLAHPGEKITLEYVSTNRRSDVTYNDDLVITRYPEFDINFAANKGHPHALAANLRNLEHALLYYKVNYASDKIPTDKKYDYLYAEIGANPVKLLDKPNVHGCIGMVGVRDCARLTRFTNYLDETYNKKGMDDAERARFKSLSDGTNHQMCLGRAQDCSISAKYLIFLHSTYDMSIDDILTMMLKKKAIISHICFMFDESVLVHEEGEIKGMGVYFKKFWSGRSSFLKRKYISFTFIGDSSLTYIHRWDTYMDLLMRTYVTIGNSHFEIHKTDHRINTIFVEITRCTVAKRTVFRNELVSWRFDCFSKDKLVLKWFDLQLDMTKTRGYRLTRKYHVISSVLYDQIFQFLFKTDKSTFVITNALKAASSFNNRCTFNGADIIAPEYQLGAEELFDVVFVIYLIVYRRKNQNGLLLKDLVDDEKKISSMIDMSRIGRVFEAWKHRWTMHESWLDKFSSIFGLCKYLKIGRMRADVGIEHFADCITFEQYIHTMLVEETGEVGNTEEFVFEGMPDGTPVPFAIDIAEGLLKSTVESMVTVSDVKGNGKGKNKKVFDTLKTSFSLAKVDNELIEMIDRFTVVKVSGNENACCFRSLFKAIDIDFDTRKFLDMMEYYYLDNKDSLDFGDNDSIVKTGLDEVFSTKIGSVDFLTFFSYISGINIIIVVKGEILRVPNVTSSDTTLANTIIVHYSYGGKIGHYDYVVNTKMDRPLIKQRFFDVLTKIIFGSRKYDKLYKNCKALIMQKVNKFCKDNKLPITKTVLKLDEILNVFGVKSVNKYLEIGASPGGTLIYVVDRFAPSKVKGISIENEGIKMFPEAAPFISVGDFRDMDLDYMDYDFIFFDAAVATGNDYANKILLDNFLRYMDDLDAKFWDSCTLIVKISNVFSFFANINTYNKMFPNLLSRFKYFKPEVSNICSSEIYAIVHNSDIEGQNLETITSKILLNLQLKDIKPVEISSRLVGGGNFNFRRVPDIEINSLERIILQYYNNARSICDTFNAIMNSHYNSGSTHRTNLHTLEYDEIEEKQDTGKADLVKLSTERNAQLSLKFKDFPEEKKVERINEACKDILATFLVTKRMVRLKDFISSIGRSTCGGMINAARYVGEGLLVDSIEISSEKRLFGNIRSIAGLLITDLVKREYLNHRSVITSNLGHYVYVNNYYKKKKDDKNDSVAIMARRADIHSEIIRATKHRYEKTCINALINKTKVESCYEEDTESLQQPISQNTTIDEVISKKIEIDNNEDKVSDIDMYKMTDIVEKLKGKTLCSSNEMGVLQRLTDYYGYDTRVHVIIHNGDDNIVRNNVSSDHNCKMVYDAHLNILSIYMVEDLITIILPKLKLLMTELFGVFNGFLVAVIDNFNPLVKCNDISRKLVDFYNSNIFGLLYCNDNEDVYNIVSEEVRKSNHTSISSALISKLDTDARIGEYLNKVAIQYLPSSDPNSKFVNSRLEARAKMFATEAIIESNHSGVWERHYNSMVGEIHSEEKYQFIRANDADKYDYEYAFNGKSLVKRKNGVFPLHGSKELVLVSKDTRMMNTAKMSANIEEWSKEEMHVCEYVFVNGLAGCGKSYNIVASFNPISDVIITATRSNAQELRTKVQKKYGNIEDVKFKIRTIDSVLCDSVTTYRGCHTMFVDEVFMAHAGNVLWVVQRIKPKYVISMGDVRQIPYIERILHSVEYGDITKFSQCIAQLGVSLRCPLDVAATFDNAYRPRNDDIIRVDTGFKTTNSVLRSMSYSRNISLAEIAKYGKMYGKDVIIMTFKEAEADELRKNGINALTVHQQQGITSRFVVIWRKSAKPNDEIYKSESHILVALTRHTERCFYHSPISDRVVEIMERSFNFTQSQLKAHLVDKSEVGNLVIPERMLENKGRMYIDARIGEVNSRKRGGSEYDDTLVMLDRYDGNRSKIRYFKKILSPFTMNTMEIARLLQNGGNSIGIANDFYIQCGFKNTYQENTKITEMMINNGYTDGLSEEIIAVDDVADMRLFRYKAAFRGNYGEPSVDVLQSFFDALIPGASYRDYYFDPQIIENSNLNLYCDPLKFDPTMKLEAKRTFDKLVPNLKTHMPATRPNSQLETLIAVIKRNLNVPKLQAKIDYPNMVKMMVTRFVDTYIPKKNMYVLEGYYFDKIEPNMSHVNSWLETQAAKLDRNVDVDFDLNEADLSYYHCMIKPTPKPVMDATGINSYSALQTICYHDKNINTIFCSTFRILKKRILSVLDRRFKIFTDISPDDFADLLSSEFDASLLDTAHKLEIDISKYDKSQGKLFLDIEMEIYRIFGLPEELLMRWYEAHQNTTLYDRVNKLKFFVKYQRKSGNASTYLGNTVVLMVVLATLFDLKDALLVMFSGDDSLILHREPLLDRNEECANLFNLESKFFRYRYPYFCSKFLINVDGFFRFIPDPFKVLIKLGRTDLVNYEHMEDYRVSACDLLKSYDDLNIDHYLSEAMDERYAKGGTIMVDYSELLHNILAFISTKERFSKLYYIEHGSRINLDPSRPKLD